MEYRQKTLDYTVDVVEMESDRYTQLNEIFKKVISEKYPATSNIENLKVNKMILISGFYRAEFDITELK